MQVIRIQDSLEPRSDLSEQKRKQQRQGKSKTYGEILSTLLDLNTPNPAIYVEQAPLKSAPMISPSPYLQIHTLKL